MLKRFLSVESFDYIYGLHTNEYCKVFEYSCCYTTLRTTYNQSNLTEFFENG